MRHAAGNGTTAGAIGVGSVLLGVAMLGSLVVLGTLGATRRRAPRQAAPRRAHVSGPKPDGEDAGRSALDEVPVLTDVVDAEELQRPAAEPPLLTDEVVPGRYDR
jgi:hypothetical protein